LKTGGRRRETELKPLTCEHSYGNTVLVSFFLIQAATFIETLQRRQGLVVACPEEIAFRRHWIDEKLL
jgi:dTDP-glucose pyrophosphorylase